MQGEEQRERENLQGHSLLRAGADMGLDGDHNSSRNQELDT